MKRLSLSIMVAFVSMASLQARQATAPELESVNSHCIIEPGESGICMSIITATAIPVGTFSIND